MKLTNYSRTTKAFILIAILVTIVVVGFFSYSTTVTKNIDSYEYELPFGKGSRYKVVQGYGGLFSHRYIAALDFEMPVGTPIYAARDGVVFRYRDNSDQGGFLSKYKDKANYIIIKHDDGSFGCYWHLKKNGVVIRSGPVLKGQLIGYSGASGQVVRPHLHFSVKKKLSYKMNSFVRTLFKTTKGTILLGRGGVYERPKD